MNEAGGALDRVHTCMLKNTGLLFGNKLWWDVIGQYALLKVAMLHVEIFSLSREKGGKKTK